MSPDYEYFYTLSSLFYQGTSSIRDNRGKKGVYIVAALRLGRVDSGSVPGRVISLPQKDQLVDKYNGQPRCADGVLDRAAWSDTVPARLSLPRG